MNEDALRVLVRKIVSEMQSCPSSTQEISAIPVEASGRHVHLSAADFAALFGTNAAMEAVRPLSQPGQFLTAHRVRLIGPKGALNNVAVLGPCRGKTQVEISQTDALALGIQAPVRLSGELENAADVHIQSDGIILPAKMSTIIATRHIHMTPADASMLGVQNGQRVSVRVCGSRPLVLEDVAVRADEAGALALHIDHDEANAAGCTKGTICTLHGAHVPQTPRFEESASKNRIALALVTERCVRDAHAKGEREIFIRKRAMVTPLANDTLRELGIALREN